MSTSAGKPYHHGDLRRALITAARELVRETGPAKLTLRGVAARAEVSPAAPYRHFADRDALLAGVAEQGFAELAVAMTPTEPSLDALHQVGAAYLEFALREPQLYRLMFGPVDRAAHPGLAAAERELTEIFREALRKAQIAGVVQPQDPEDVMLTMRCVMHGLTSLVVDGQIATEQAADAARRVMSVVDRGLLPR